jgi:predicted MPP superfamily phosphohydrolase
MFRFRTWFIILTLLILGGGWGFKIFGEWSAGQLECNHMQLSETILPGAGPLRIALISDLHNNPQLFEKAIGHISTAKPDLIIFCGDLVTAEERFRRTRWAIEGFRTLRSIAPTYAILGNHDYEKQEQVERVFATAGIPLLRNKATDWTTPSGSTLRIIGLGDWNEADEAPAACMRPANQEEHPVLLLSHDPESRWYLRAYDWDLMLSGHTHGGQIGNPFTGEPISFRSSTPAGLFPFEGNRHVIVTRGIGAIFAMRFFCPPEVTILELK